MCLEHRLKAEPVVEEQALLEMLKLAKDDFRSASAKDKTLLQVMLEKSGDQLKANGGKPKATPTPF